MNDLSQDIMSNSKLGIRLIYVILEEKTNAKYKLAALQPLTLYALRIALSTFMLGISDVLCVETSPE
jgi:hypothetical protein